MRLKYLIFPLLFLVYQNGNAQELKYKIGVGTGIMVINSIKDAFEPNYLGGWLNTNSIDVGVDYSMPNYTVESSIGYMHNYNLGVTGIFGPDAITNYLSIKIGYKRKFLSKNFLGVSTSNYILTEKDLEFFYQRRYFANLDFKYERFFSDKYSLAIVTPITYFPVATFKGGLISKDIDFVVWAELIGLQIYFTRYF